MRRRTFESLVVVVALALISACGSSGTKTAGTTTSAAPSTTVATTTTTVPTAAFSPAVWPWVASTLRFHDPVRAARSFATEYLRMTAPVVGTFQQGDSRSGEVAIRPSNTGPVTTVIVRQLGNDGTWWVLGAATKNIELTTPAALATISSPVTLRGMSTAFEAVVNVSIRQDNTRAALAEARVMGGSNGTMGPFSSSIPFSRATSRAGSIVLYTISPKDGQVAEATVIRVHYGGA